MMFHDMGYFVPYPSKLYTIPEVSNTMSLSYRLSLGKTKNPVKILLLTFKRLSLRMIKSVLQKHNTVYLVPSQFMVEPTQK